MRTQFSPFGSRFFMMLALAFGVAASTALETVAADSPQLTIRFRSNFPGFRSGSSQDVQAVGNLAYVATSQGLDVLDTSDPTIPRRVGGYLSSGFAQSILIAGRYAYLGGDMDGSGRDGTLEIVDISNPASPIRIGGYAPSAARVTGLALVGRYVYLATGEGGISPGSLIVVDVSNPRAPLQVGSYSTTTSANNVWINGNLAYVVTGFGGGMEILDISVPSSLRRVGFYPMSTQNLWGIQVVGNYAYVTGDQDFLAIDVSDPTRPQLVGRHDMDASQGGRALYVSGNYAYVSTYRGEFEILDISEPSRSRLVGSYVTGAIGYGNDIESQYAYLATGVALEIVDIGNPSNPARVGRFPTYWRVSDVLVMGNHAYAANNLGGLQILDVSDSARPELVASDSGMALSIQVAGRHCYVASSLPALRIFDVSNPDKITLVGSYGTNDFASAVWLSGDHAYVFGSGGFQIIDVSNTTSPQLVSDFGGFFEDVTDVKVVSGLAYVLTKDENDPLERTKLRIFDVSRPSVPNELALLTTSWSSITRPRLDVWGTTAYIATGHGVEMIDVSDPANPNIIGDYSGFQAQTIRIVGTYAFVTHGFDGLKILDVSNPTNIIVSGGYGANEFVGVQVVGNSLFVAHNFQGLTVLDLDSSFARLPSIVAQPNDQRALQGGDANFYAEASGSIPIRYQWQFDGADILGATQPLLTLTNVQFSNAGHYACVITNSSGKVCSSNAILSVDFPPAIVLTDPSDVQVFLAPATVPLTAEASDRDINGSVVKVEFFVGTNLLGTVTNAPPWTNTVFTAVWTNVLLGTYVLTARATDNEGASSVSSPNRITVTNKAVFQLSQPHYFVNESNEAVNIVVRRNSGGPATINLYTRPISALEIVESGIGHYYGLSSTLTFAPESLVTNVSITLVNDQVYRGNKEFLVKLSAPSPTNWSLAYPNEALVTILDDDPTSTTNSFTDVVRPTNAPTALSTLSVRLIPPEGQWRFAWETSWRTNGAIANGLIAGTYRVEFRPLADHETPDIVSKVIPAGADEMMTGVYTPTQTPPQYGSLSIRLPLGGQWRLPSDWETNWQSGGAVVTGLLAGLHVVEFTPPTGFRTLDAQEVKVEANRTNTYEAAFEANTPPIGMVPSPVPSFTTNLANTLRAGLPYAFNGQIRAGGEYGSGFVVKPRTVLTAAHVVFDFKSNSLTYRTNIWWFFERDRGVNEPPPQVPRGAHLLIGYSAARGLDFTNGLPAGESSVESQDLDVAALYFFEDAGRGGFGGYLTSGTTNDWLGDASLKMLLGYPVEHVPEGDRGRLHAIGPYYDAFELVTNQVYRTDRITSYGGNSGGPLCVQTFNSQGEHFYIPAGVYLGGSGRTVVRAIDLDVVNLINAAERSANGGTNSTGGGVITVVTAVGGSGAQQTVLDVLLGPPAAVRLGAAWRVSPTNYGGIRYFKDLTNFMGWSDTLVFRSNNFGIEARKLDGFYEPTNQAIVLAPGNSSSLNLTYEVIPPGLIMSRLTNRFFAIGMTGTLGTKYEVESTPSMGISNNWLPWQQVTLTHGTNWMTNTAPGGVSNGFYRARWLSD